MCCNDLPGDSWRTRHDSVKIALASECEASKLPHDVEVYGAFADLIPATVTESGGELEWSRSRQGLVPDFRLRLPTQEGPTDCLAELKLISAGVSWYPRGSERRGTDKRADLLQGEYKRKLSRLDRSHHGVGPDEVGPLVRRLESFGKLESLVVGAWGEGSKDLHLLIRTLAECRMSALSRARGRQGSDSEIGVIQSHIRRTLSLSFVRAQGLCLISRLCHLGSGAKEAAGRRDLAKRSEYARKKEMLSHFEAHIRGRGLNRSGLVFVP